MSHCPGASTGETAPERSQQSACFAKAKEGACSREHPPLGSPINTQTGELADCGMCTYANGKKTLELQYCRCTDCFKMAVLKVEASQALCDILLADCSMMQEVTRGPCMPAGVDIQLRIHSALRS